MRTRKYKKNELEGLQKVLITYNFFHQLRDIKHTTQNTLMAIVKAMTDREKIKKTNYMLGALEFELECCTSKNERREIELKYKELLKNYEKPPKNLLSEINNAIPDHNIVSNTNGKQNINGGNNSSISNFFIVERDLHKENRTGHTKSNGIHDTYNYSNTRAALNVDSSSTAFHSNNDRHKKKNIKRRDQHV